MKQKNNKNKIRVGAVLIFAILLVSYLSDFALHYGSQPEASGKHHPAWHYWNAFDFIFGLVGCLLLILLSKNLGKYFLERKPDHYERRLEG